MKTITSIIFILLFILFASFVADARAETPSVAIVELHCTYNDGFLNVIVRGNAGAAKFNNSTSFKPAIVAFNNNIFTLREVTNGNRFDFVLNMSTMKAVGRTVFDSGRKVTADMDCSIKTVKDFSL